MQLGAKNSSCVIGNNSITSSTVQAQYFYAKVTFNMSTPLEEKDLLQAVATDDRAAFANLYTMYLRCLQRYTCLFVGATEDAKRIIQETFMRIRERRNTLPQVVFFKAYLYQVSKKLVIE